MTLTLPAKVAEAFNAWCKTPIDSKCPSREQLQAREKAWCKYVEVRDGLEAGSIALNPAFFPGIVQTATQNLAIVRQA